MYHHSKMFTVYAIFHVLFLSTPSDIHSCLFLAITSSKVEEMIGPCVAWTEAVIVICQTTLKSVKTTFIVCSLWSIWQNLKAETLLHFKSNKAQSSLILLDGRCYKYIVKFTHQPKTSQTKRLILRFKNPCHFQLKMRNQYC